MGFPRSNLKRAGAAMVLLLALAPACVRMSLPMIVPPSAEEEAPSWRMVRAGPDGGAWSVEAIFIPGRSEALLAEGDIVAEVDGRQVPFTFDPDFQRLRAAFPSPPAGDHLFTAAPRDAAAGFPTFSMRFSVAGGPERSPGHPPQ